MPMASSIYRGSLRAARPAMSWIRAVQHQSCFLLLLAEQRVAAGEGQPLLAAHDRHRTQLHRIIKVSDHAADQCQLLGILLPEVGTVLALARIGQVQQLGYDCQHAIEVPRS